MIVHFSEEFQKYTNGLPEVSVECERLGDGLMKVFNLFPQLYVRLMDNKGEVACRSSFQFNDEHIWESEECERLVCSEDVLSLCGNVPSGAGEVGKWIGAIIGVILIIVGAVMNVIVPGSGVPVMIFGAQMFVAGIISGLISTFILANDLPTPNGLTTLNDSAAYTFSGIRNTTASGTPFQLVYGLHRVGGHVLNMFTEPERYVIKNFKNEDVDVFGNILFAQIGLCEGEIQNVSNIEVNQLPLSYYNEIYSAPDPAYIRYGTRDQEVMPLFSRVENTNSLNRKVTNVSGIISAPAVTTKAQLVYGAYYNGDVKVGPGIWVAA